MKLWQLTSIFRDEEALLEEEFKKAEWSFYFNILKDLNSIISAQKRDILDMQVDDLLLRNICAKSKKQIYGSKNLSTIYSYSNRDTDKVISMSEAIDLFDHDSIEEVFEKSEATVNK